LRGLRILDGSATAVRSLSRSSRGRVGVGVFPQMRCSRG
jgi:hypothetical protein